MSGGVGGGLELGRVWTFFLSVSALSPELEPQIGGHYFNIASEQLMKKLFPISALDKKSDMISALAHVAFKGTLGTLTTELVDFIIIT